MISTIARTAPERAECQVCGLEYLEDRPVGHLYIGFCARCTGHLATLQNIPTCAIEDFLATGFPFIPKDTTPKE